MLTINTQFVPIKPLDGHQALEIYKKNESWAVGPTLGFTAGIATGAVLVVAGLVTIAAVCVFTPFSLPLLGTAIVVGGTLFAVSLVAAGVTSGFFGSMGAWYLIDREGFNMTMDLESEFNSDKVVDVVSQIKSDQTLAELAKKMNQPQLNHLKTKIGDDRYETIIERLQRYAPNNDL